MCTAGLAFKLVHGLLKHLRDKKTDRAFEIDPKESLSLSAMGTIADLVPLIKENRILARFGLKHLGKHPSPGLRALLDESGVNTDFPPESEDVTFKLAPRINACGRLDDAEVASSLMLKTDMAECRKLAKQMNAYNEERKEIEARLTDQALLQGERRFSDRPAVVACGSGDAWNPGVVGIVAGKMSHSLGKACIVLAEAEDGSLRGSGRGVKGVNLVDALSSCKDLLTHWGGHPVAVGLSLEKENLKAFTEEFYRTVCGGALEPVRHTGLSLHDRQSFSIFRAQRIGLGFRNRVENGGPHPAGRPQPRSGFPPQMEFLERAKAPPDGITGLEGK